MTQEQAEELLKEWGFLEKMGAYAPSAILEQLVANNVVKMSDLENVLKSWELNE